MKKNNLTALSLDELSALQDILKEELKLWTKKLNSYSIYETSDSVDAVNYTVSHIIVAGARIKFLKEDLTKLSEVIAKLIEE